MDVLKHPAFTVRRRIRLRQCRGHRDSPGGTWPRLVEKTRVARLQVPKQPVERLFEVLQGAAANHAWSVHVTELAHVNLGPAELRVDKRDHLVEDSAPLRFGQEGHLLPPPRATALFDATTANVPP